MKIRTESQKLLQLRRGMIDLYVSDHPLECASCPADGHCELQDMADKVGITASSYARGAMHRPMATDESNPYFAFDPTLCIVCSRCVRAATRCRAPSRLPSRGAASSRSGGEPGPAVPRIRVRLLRRVHRVLSHRALMEQSIIGLGSAERP